MQRRSLGTGDPANVRLSPTSASLVSAPARPTRRIGLGASVGWGYGAAVGLGWPSGSLVSTTGGVAPPAIRLAALAAWADRA
jgi:hypothetical protein